ncbi:hypothetical protein NECID01_1290 [Nematocida sp. AWRm77]|nr:hypothetical protein NECID01_1290 [Nematocida sp. AWRm77]
MTTLPGSPEYRINQQIRLPYTNGIVTAVVEYVCYSHVMVVLTEVDGMKTIPAQGIVHREDSMYGIKDTDKLNVLFSSGDTIHGRVLSLGNCGSLVISTADEAHGVVKAVDFRTQKEIRLSNGQFLWNGVPLMRKVARI